MTKGKRILLAVLVAYIIVSSALYLHMGPFPDEGNGLFTTDQFMNGHVPYKDYSTDIKTPGMYYLLAPFLAFTRSFEIIRFAMFFLNAASAYILYMIAKKLFDEKTALTSVVILLFTLTIPGAYGYIASPDRPLLFSCLLAVFLFLKGLDNIKYLVPAGIFIGLAFLFKQVGVMLLAFVFVFFLISIIKGKNTKNLKPYASKFFIVAISSLIPIAIIFTHFMSLGAFDSMFHWTFTEVNNLNKGDSFYENVFDVVSGNQPLSYIAQYGYLFTILSAVWVLSAAWIMKFVKTRKNVGRNEIFLAAWLIGLSYPFVIIFDKYLQMLPALSIASSIMVLGLASSYKTSNPRAIFMVFVCVLSVAALCLSAYSEYNLQISRENFYSQEKEVVAYIKDHVLSEDKFYIFAYSPEIYFLSERRPPTGFYLLYPAKQHVNSTTEQKHIMLLEENKVNYIVVDNGQPSKYQNPLVYSYIIDNYMLEKSIGQFDVYSRAKTELFISSQ